MIRPKDTHAWQCQNHPEKRFIMFEGNDGQSGFPTYQGTQTSFIRQIKAEAIHINDPHL